MRMILECGDKIYVVSEYNAITIQDNILNGSCYIPTYDPQKPECPLMDSVCVKNVKIDKMHYFQDTDKYMECLLKFIKPKPVSYNCNTMPDNTMGVIVDNMYYTGSKVIKVDGKVSVYINKRVEHLTNTSWTLNVTHNIDFSPRHTP